MRCCSAATATFAGWSRRFRPGVRVTVVSTVKTQPPQIADELRRQADAFVELNDLLPEIGRAKTL